MSDGVRIVEVGPRDGLQNERIAIPLEAKLRFIQSLRDAGCDDIEATSFVSPKWVPQLADAASLWPLLPAGPDYSGLVPNLKGLERAIELGVKRIAVFTAASESFTLKNINMTLEQSLEAIRNVIEEYRSTTPDGWIRGYVSTAFECPFEGSIAPERTIEVTRKLFDLGVDEVSVGDTVGAAVPVEVKSLTKMLEDSVPMEQIAYHFHDTRGTAIANVSTALELGIRIFDSSAAGLGGCPYAPGAGGNLATEDLVYFLHRSGVPTRIDPDRLAQASREVLALLGRPASAKAQQAQLSASGTSPR